MGCRFSKSPVVVSSINVDIQARREETYRLVAELRSLGVASGPPPALMLDDSGLHPVSLAVARTPELKEAISKNHALLSFVNDHLSDAIITTLRSLTGVKGHVDKAQVILSAVYAALECFAKENTKRRNEKKKNKKKKSTNRYSEEVDKSKKSRAVGDLFAGLNTGELRLACERQRSLLALLCQRNHELERRLSSVKKWRKAWNVICMAGVVVVLACSVMLAAVASPAAVVAGATASATAMKCAEPFLNSLWDEWESSLQREKDIIATMQRKGGLAMHELENIRSIVEKLKIHIDVVLKSVDFAIDKEDGEEIGVKIGIENIMAKKGEFEKIMDSLKEKLDSFDGEIRKAATDFLEIITKDI